MIVRRVNDSGCIRFKDQSLFISQSLSGWNLGLKSIQNQKTQLWFAQLLLGHLDQPPSVLSALISAPSMLKTNSYQLYALTHFQHAFSQKASSHDTHRSD
jgi:hypothetical protein